MRVTMKISQVHSPDGTSKLEYLAGRTYDVEGALGARWVSLGLAEGEAAAETPAPEETPRFGRGRKGGDD